MDMILFGVSMSAYAFTIYGLNEATYNDSDFVILFGVFVQMLLCAEIANLFPFKWMPLVLIPLAIVGEYPFFHAIKEGRILPVKLGIKLRSSLDDEL